METWSLAYIIDTHMMFFLQWNEENSFIELGKSIGRLDWIVRVAIRRCQWCKRLESESLSFRYLFLPGRIRSPVEHFRSDGEGTETEIERNATGIKSNKIRWSNRPLPNSIGIAACSSLGQRDSSEKSSWRNYCALVRTSKPSICWFDPKKAKTSAFASRNSPSTWYILVNINHPLPNKPNEYMAILLFWYLNSFHLSQP